MAIGSDRVQVYKQESTALGGDDADAGFAGTGTPVPIDPQEDAIEAAGVYLQDGSNRDENCFVARDGNDLSFRDPNNPTPITLSSLASVAPERIVSVAQSGGDFTDIATANTAAAALTPTAANPVSIQIAPGTYTIPPFAMLKYVTYVGLGNWLDVILKTNDNNAHFITGNELSTLQNMSIEGPTGVGFAAVHHSVVSTNPLFLRDVLLRAGYYGVFVDGSTPGSGKANVHAMVVGNHYLGSPINQMFRVIDDAFLSAFFCAAMAGPGSAVVTGFHIEGIGSELRGNLLSYLLGGTALFADNGADIKIEGFVVNNAALGMDIGATGTGTSIGVVAGDFRDGLTEGMKTAVGSDATVSFSGFADKSKFPNISDPSNVVANLLDTTFKEAGLITIGDHSIGSEKSGRVLSTGEGRSHTRNMSVFTNTNDEAGTWADIAANLILDDGVTQALLPGLTTGNALYIGGGIEFPGLAHKIATALVEGAGALTAQYWNGSAWVALRLLATGAATLAATAEIYFQNAIVEDIRFGDTAGWATKSLDGVTKFWVRFIVQTASITTAPVADFMKLQTNHWKAGATGREERYGLAMAENDIPLILSDLDGAAPGDSTVDYTANISIDETSNVFANNTIDGIAGSITVVEGMFTGAPITFVVGWKPATNGAGDVEIEMRYGIAAGGDVLDGTLPDDLLAEVVSVSGQIDQVLATIFSIPVHNALPGNRIVFSIFRDATGGNADDTFAGNIELVDKPRAVGRFWRA